MLIVKAFDVFQYTAVFSILSEKGLDKQDIHSILTETVLEADNIWKIEDSGYIFDKSLQDTTNNTK